MKLPLCCGAESRWVENVVNKGYWFCDTCRDEVIDTDNKSMRDIFNEWSLEMRPILDAGYLQSLSPSGYYTTIGGNITHVPDPRDSMGMSYINGHRFKGKLASNTPACIDCGAVYGTVDTLYGCLGARLSTTSP